MCVSVKWQKTSLIALKGSANRHGFLGNFTVINRSRWLPQEKGTNHLVLFGYIPPLLVNTLLFHLSCANPTPPADSLPLH